MAPRIEIETLHLFPVLDELLISLLSELTDDEWGLQTVAKLWKVKDVAAHLLDGNLRGLSTSRDNYFGESAGNINSQEDLVKYLNGLNLSWTDALKRLSPKVLISLLQNSGKEYTTHLQSLNPFENAIFPVAWAGQTESPNWFHIAREYTERFLHQQQIRDATGRPGLMKRELFYPFIDTLMCALPYTFRNNSADEGTIVSVVITSEIGGRWNLVQSNSQWNLTRDLDLKPSAAVKIDPDTAWKLFSKSWSPDHVIDLVDIQGDQVLGKQLLKMVSVMA
ncbi:maleylpyruvate isomerase N-terminal domain-containing protein [Lunatibacter salilacus]|uniref:maleylpyruvate isomerase N-terminal domain-containing protein n=1 Tax=Lunatibacter salilacus TaxID=2483804 RepID=UPI00131D969F|nr:maleylpyruvate isomerase N-terminal domain-containing protein [Lunatibacter salilacus]